MLGICGLYGNLHVNNGYKRRLKKAWIISVCGHTVSNTSINKARETSPKCQTRLGYGLINIDHKYVIYAHVREQIYRKAGTIYIYSKGSLTFQGHVVVTCSLLFISRSLIIISRFLIFYSKGLIFISRSLIFISRSLIFFSRFLIFYSQSLIIFISRFLIFYSRSLIFIPGVKWSRNY